MRRTNKVPEKKVRQLFDRIAANYDTTNNVISLGSHKKWRKKTMQQLALEPGGKVLDLCCGTGDWTIALAQAVGSTGAVVGLDFSSEMLAIAKTKLAAANIFSQVTLLQGDAMKLPFADNSFDVVTIGFGLRNVPDAAQVLREMQRVVVPGGMIACLETSQPENRLIYPFWQLYFKLMPVIAKFKHNDKQDYVYLQQTTQHFFSAKQLETLFRSTGLIQTNYQSFMFGASCLHTGIKKERSKI